MIRKQLTLLALVLLALGLGLSHLSPTPRALSSDTEASDEAGEAIQLAENASRDAFVAVHDADKAGADVSGLTIDFNIGLNLLERANLRHEEQSYADAFALAKEAAGIFDNIIPQAQAMREEAAAEASTGRTITIAAVPVTVALITVLSHLLLRWWRRHELDKILEMRIEERGEG